MNKLEHIESSIKQSHDAGKIPKIIIMSYQFYLELKEELNCPNIPYEFFSFNELAKLFGLKIYLMNENILVDKFTLGYEVDI